MDGAFICRGCARAVRGHKSPTHHHLMAVLEGNTGNLEDEVKQLRGKLERLTRENADLKQIILRSMEANNGEDARVRASTRD